VLEEVTRGARYTHPWLDYIFQVAAYEPYAQVTQQITNRSNEVRAEMVHLVAREGDEMAEAWVGLRGAATLALGRAPVHVAYRPAERELPFAIKLLDFRKIDYPGISMAAGFESDVQLSDPQRGLILMRKISMNNPLRYRGFSFYQSSYIPGPTETTVLSVRNDPGTPVVYAGFLIVIAGVVSMFLQHPARPARSNMRKGRSGR
jgi:cytochrome c biogenesis protein ResB